MSEKPDLERKSGQCRLKPREYAAAGAVLGASAMAARAALAIAPDKLTSKR